MQRTSVRPSVHPLVCPVTTKTPHVENPAVRLVAAAADTRSDAGKTRCCWHG